uniref:Uncharacterized protein n=1 Tax=Echinococcus canadensis TaxID=519352 RepID=A0A915ESQ1_9CEST
MRLSDPQSVRPRSSLCDSDMVYLRERNVSPLSPASPKFPLSSAQAHLLRSFAFAPVCTLWIPSMPKPIAFMPAVLPTCTRESRRGEIYAFTLSLPCPAVCFSACPSLCLVYCLLKLGDFVDQSHALWTALHSWSEHFSVTFTDRSTWTSNLFGEEKQRSASVYYETVDGCRLCYYFADDKTTSELGHFVDNSGNKYN